MRIPERAVRRKRRHVGEAGGFRSLALGHVVREPDEEAAPVEVEGAEAEIDWEHGPVLAPVMSMDEKRFAGDGVRPDVFGGGEIEIHLYVCDSEREELFTRVAEAFARALVHVDDAPFAVVHDHRVAGLIEYGA